MRKILRIRALKAWRTRRKKQGGNRKWTIKETNILKNLFTSKKYREIAKILNRTERQVQDKSQRMGLRKK